MRVLICGGRHFQDAETVHRELVRLHWQRSIKVLIHGSVTGVGIAAEAWARRNGVSIVRYPPNWEYYGKRAESLRNAFMVEDSRPDLVVAFPGGRHTADLVHRATDSAIGVLLVGADEDQLDLSQSSRAPNAALSMINREAIIPLLTFRPTQASQNDTAACDTT